MRGLAIVSLLLLIAALVLNVLLLLAGTRTDFLEDVDILSLNTSDVGRTLVTSSSSPISTTIAGAINSNPVASAVAAANPQASSVAAALVANEANSVAQAVGLHDFYSIHVQNWCEGYYTPSPYASNATQNVTSCSNRTALWDFNLTQILQSELKVGYLASELDIPQDVNDGLTVLQTTFKAMFYLYCVAIGTTGVAILAGFAALLLDGRISACANSLWALLTAAVSIAASGIATAIMIAGTDVVNSKSDQYGIIATKGTKFLAMTWAASACLIVAFLVWSVDCCVGGEDRVRPRRHHYRSANKETYA